MSDPSIHIPRTNWEGVFVSMLVPLVVAAGFVYLALQPQWEQTGTGIKTLLALIPIEFARVFVVRILRDTYRHYRNPTYAVRLFLLWILLLAGLCLATALYELGLRALSAALVDPRTWRLIVPIAAIVIVDGVVSLYFFRGDARREAARLDAIADDAEDWIQVAIYPLLVLIASAFIFVVPHVEWVRNLSPGTLRSAGLLYVACYFLGKGILIAHVHTATFERTGRRLLSAGWIQVLAGAKWSRIAMATKVEAKQAEDRREVLAMDVADVADNPK